MKKRFNSYDSSAFQTLKTKFNSQIKNNKNVFEKTGLSSIHGKHQKQPLGNKENSFGINNNNAFRESLLSQSQGSTLNNLNSLYNLYKESSEEIIPFDDFKDIINAKLTDYKLENGDIRHEFNEKLLSNLSLDTKMKIRDILRKETKFKFQSNKANINAQSSQDNEYLNPYDSAIILKKNKQIFSNIKIDFYERMKHIYNEEIKQINNIIYNQQHMPKKIKVTNLALYGSEVLNPDKKNSPAKSDYLKIVPTGKNEYIIYLNLIQK